MFEKRKKGFWDWVWYGKTDLEYLIDQNFEVGKNWKVMLDSKNEISDIVLKLSKASSVRVKGAIKKEPVIATQGKMYDGTVVINSLYGKLWLPQDSDLEISLNLSKGSVSGAVSHSGSITTLNGSIQIELYAPLNVKVNVKDENVEMRNLIKDANGRYVPLTGSVQGSLRLSAPNGSISVNYKCS